MDIVKSSDHSQYPTYVAPSDLLAGVAWSVLLMQKRSFRKDAIQALKGVSPIPIIHHPENIPSEGPCLFTLNHYYRAGYQAWWSALALSAAVSFDIHWTMTGTFTYPGQRRELILKPLSTWVLHRIGKVYGFTNMPAMPPDPKEVIERTRSIRKVVSFVRHTEKPVIALAPEGRDILTGQLGEPPSGSGRFMMVLARYRLPFLPTGIYEEDGNLHVSFGEPYRLDVQTGLAPKEQDGLAAQIVMKAIARQLPARIRGDYG